MKALLITKCGCTRIISIPERSHYIVIRLKEKEPFNFVQVISYAPILDDTNINVRKFEIQHDAIHRDYLIFEEID